MSDDDNSQSKYRVKVVRGPFVRLDPHPNAVETESELRRVIAELPGPYAADLFCGAGGLSLGLADAGYNVVVGVDNDEDALETHRAHHPGLSANLDLGDPDTVERLGKLLRKLKVELVAGGPPCQPFSKAGRSAMRDLVRRGVRPSHDMRRELWQSFLRVVAIAEPKAVLMENVPDMALDRDMWILRTLSDELDRLGYSVHQRVIATGDFGVPQFRQRLFVVALHRRYSYHWPDPDLHRVTVRNAIGDLPAVDGGWRPTNGDDPSDPVASGWIEYGGPTSTFQEAMRSGVPQEQCSRLYDHITRPVREDDAEAFELMDADTRYSELPAELQRYRSDIFDDKYKRLDWNNLSRTIVAHIAKDGYWYIHPEQSRTITVREAARLQTFPDHIRFAGPPSSAFRQIGNAVPPRMGFRLAESIRKSLDEARKVSTTTPEVAAKLAGWFSSAESNAVPWLKSETRWQVILAETLFSRLQVADVQSAWQLIKPLRDVDETRANMKLLSMGVGALGRAHRISDVEQMIEFVQENPECLASTASAGDLGRIPGVMPAVADLAIRVHPGPAEDRNEPVLATTGVVRVASRFLGGHVEENRNRLSDGRIAVAQLIGGDDNSHQAHLALLELAVSHCTPASPKCGSCPLLSDCTYAANSGYQSVLAVHQPS